MRSLRVTCLVALVGACSAFGDNADEGRGGTSPSADAGSDASNGSDGSAPAPGTIATVASENAATRFVATDRTSIYWWSLHDEAIYKADKANPAARTVVASRPQLTVTALAADDASIYWVETGGLTDGGTSTRIMRLVNGEPTALTETTGVVLRLALSASQVGATEAGSSIDVGSKSGPLTNIVLGISPPLITADDTTFYYFFSQTLCRLNGNPVQVAIGLFDATAMIADASSIYVAFPKPDGTTALLAVDKAGTGADASGNPPLATFSKGALYLALDNLGIVVGNAGDGSVSRVSRTPGVAPTSIASGRVSLNAVAADADGVYWSTDTGEVGWFRR